MIAVASAGIVGNDASAAKRNNPDRATKPVDDTNPAALLRRLAIGRRIDIRSASDRRRSFHPKFTSRLAKCID